MAIPEMTLTDYMSRKEGWRGLTNIEDNVDTSIRQLKDYIEKRGGSLITTTGNDRQHEDEQNDKKKNRTQK